MNTSNKKIKILDCTLRDGGYYNNWNFKTKLVTKYLKAISESKIEAVELGYRIIDKKQSLGKFANIDERLLKTLKINNNILKFVMINSKDFFINNKFSSKLVYKNFISKNKSFIDGFRIATNIKDFKKCKKLCQHLSNLGYRICLNLMQSSSKNDEFFSNTAKEISTWKTIDILYFADSFGSMFPEDVYRVTKILKKNFDKEVGVHLHNNKGFGLINSIYAAKAGIDWIDSTILGMGRGSGNVSTESIILEMNNLGKHNGDIYKIENIINDFEILQKKHKWGNNLYYHLSANSNIHPTYTQTLLTDERYDKNKILDSLFYLSKKQSTSFSQEKLRDSLFDIKKIISGSWNAKGWIKGKDVLVIGAGPSVKNNQKKIISFIENKKPFVIGLNINKYVTEKYLDATIVCHETRVIIDSIKYKNLKKILILPKKSFKKILSDIQFKCNIYDYGLNIKEDQFKFYQNYCIIPKPLVISYAFSILSNSNIKNINMVGFDGFDEGDVRNDEMNEAILNFNKENKSKNLISLTPSFYNIRKNLKIL